MTTKNNNLCDHFLVAMPQLNDPHFHHSVNYICDHQNKGSIGLVINRPISLNFAELVEHMKIPLINEEIGKHPIYWGGPLQQEHGFVLHNNEGQWDTSLPITKALTLTTSKDIIDAIAKGQGPKHIFIALGYSGWGEGQLEDEIIKNSWLTCPAEQKIIFDYPPHKRWQAAAATLGIDINLISNDIGHA